MRIWSAASSSGEEPYSIAITVEEFLQRNGKKVEVKILASDVNSEMIAKAQVGRYSSNSFRGKVNDKMMEKYFSPLEDDFVINTNIKARVQFKQINLLAAHFPLKEKLDVIFCRNVMIYFDLPTKEEILKKFHHYLADDGFLILGHSENLIGAANQFRLVKNTIYQKNRGTSP